MSTLSDPRSPGQPGKALRRDRVMPQEQSDVLTGVACVVGLLTIALVSVCTARPSTPWDSC